MSWVRSRAVAALSASSVTVAVLVGLPAPASAAGESLFVEVACVSAPVSGTTWDAHFRVLNPGATQIVAIGASNYFAPAPSARPGHVVTFQPGWTSFEATFSTSQLAWTLGDDTATASASSPRCETAVSDPSVIGTPAVGSTLTMAGEQVTLLLSGYDVSYRWYTDCDSTPVQVATGRSYAVPPAAAGKRIGATITYSRGTTGLVLSSACTDPVDISPGALAPPHRSFPSTAVGASSVELVYYLNTTPAPVSLGEPTVSGADAASFRVFDDDCESFLPIGGGCTIEVAFEPQSVGAFTAQLDLDDGAGAQATLAGTAGVAPSRTGTPRVSATPRVDQPLTVIDGAWDGDPDITVGWEACTALACGWVGSGPSFTPGADEVGDSIRAVVTATNDFGTDRVVTAAVGPVRPAILPPGTLLPGAVDFPATVIGGGTSSATVYYTNSALDPVEVDPSVTGTDAASFAVVGDDCGGVVAPGEHCAIDVRFQPVVDGTLTAVLAAGDGATTALTGRAVVPKSAPPPTPPPSPAALSLGAMRVDLGKVPVRKRGKAKTVLISNSGGTPLVVQGVTVTGKHRKDVVLATTCPGDTLAPGASCTVTLRLKPSAAGRRTASLTVTSTAPGGTGSVALAGQGVRAKR